VKTEGSDETFTDNLCVWRNFACGINARIPADILPCLVGPQGYNFYFFDSSSPACGYSNGPPFFLVLFLICPQGPCITGSPAALAQPNAGFLEVVDSPTMPFALLQTTVEQQNDINLQHDGNLGAGCFNGGQCTSTYHTVSNHYLEIDLRGHQDDSNSTGILSIDGVPEKHLDQWNLAEGDRFGAGIIESQGDGVITINNPRLGMQLILDFSNVNHPCRRTGPNQPCTQQ